MLAGETTKRHPGDLFPTELDAFRHRAAAKVVAQIENYPDLATTCWPEVLMAAVPPVVAATSSQRRRAVGQMTREERAKMALSAKDETRDDGVDVVRHACLIATGFAHPSFMKTLNASVSEDGV